MNLKSLSNDVLVSNTKNLVERERAITLEVLHHLREIEVRRLFAERGFSSLFDYAVKELHYSEAAAARRINVMRLLKAMPEVENKIENGSLNLTTVSQAQQFFRKEKTPPQEQASILSSLENKSTREVERALLSMSSNPQQHYVETIRAVSADLSEVKFYADDELLGNLEKLKGLLAHAYPNMTLADLIKYLAELGLRKVDPTRKASRPAPAPNEAVRYIPATLKKRIFKRDQSRCSYVDPKTGRRCDSSYRLQLDHRIPFAMSGPTNEQNLRLLCRTHNLLHAERRFGQKSIRRFRYE